MCIDLLSEKPIRRTIRSIAASTQTLIGMFRMVVVTHMKRYTPPSLALWKDLLILFNSVYLLVFFLQSLQTCAYFDPLQYIWGPAALSRPPSVSVQITSDCHQLIQRNGPVHTRPLTGNQTVCNENTVKALIQKKQL